MDGGPFRGSRPTDRTVVGRTESVRRQSVEPQPIAAEPPKVAHHAPAQHHAPKKKSSKRFIIPIVAALLVIALVVGGWFAWSKMQSTATAIDGGKYQAVFFTNGQVYFGKLQQFNGEYMKLKDIYYLQTQQAADGEQDSQNPQQATTDQGNVQLIKLGDEVHGPEDEMIISKNQMLFFENLKSDGKVAQSIQNFKSNQ